MNTPYTTKSGLKIGIHYQPPARTWTFSRTEIMLQEALLAGRRPTAVVKSCPASTIKRALAAFWRWA